MGKRARPEAWQANWPDIVQRVRAVYPEYEAHMKYRRTVGASSGKHQFRTIDKVLKMLAKHAFPQTLFETPNAVTLQKISAQRHLYTSPKNLRQFFARFPKLPIHPDLVTVLTTLRNLNAEEREKVAAVKRLMGSGYRDTAAVVMCMDHLQAFCAQNMQRAVQFCFDGRRAPHASLDLRVNVLVVCAGFCQTTLRAEIARFQAHMKACVKTPRFTVARCLQAFQSSKSLVQSTVKKTLEQQVRHLSAFHSSLMDEMLAFESGSANVAFVAQNTKKLKYQFARLVLLLESVAAERKMALRDFMLSTSLETLEQALQRQMHNILARPNVVKTQAGSHQCTSFATFAVRFLNGCLKKHFQCDVSRLRRRELLRGVNNICVRADPAKRRTFTDEEVKRMYLVAKDPCEELLLVLLREVGLRSSALAHMRYASLLDENHQPRTMCKVLEKGRRMRAFETSATLRDKIANAATFLREHVDEANIHGCYVFNVRDPQKPSGSLWETVKRIARDAGITDVVVHPHGFRHTLVSKLVHAGNSLDLVSKFIGHADTKTTSTYYFVPTPEELGRNMINPFSEKYVPPETGTLTASLCAAKISACRKIIRVLHEHCNQEVVAHVLPDFDCMMQAIVEGEQQRQDTSKIKTDDFV